MCLPTETRVPYGAVDHCRWSLFLFHWGGIPERGIGLLVYVLLFLGVGLFPDKFYGKLHSPFHLSNISAVSLRCFDTVG